MRNLGLGARGSACGSPYGMDAASPPPVVWGGHKREGHPSTVVSGPAASEESSGLGRESPSCHQRDIPLHSATR